MRQAIMIFAERGPKLVGLCDRNSAGAVMRGIWMGNEMRMARPGRSRVSPADPSRIHDWQIAAGICLTAITFLIILLLPTATSMVLTWRRSVTFNHGFLIAPTFAYLIWMRRHELVMVRPRPDLIGLAPATLAAATWFLARLNGTAVLEELALIALVQSIVLTTVGRVAIRIVLFPLLFLYFAVPAGESLVPPLQKVTASIAVYLISLAQIPVYSDGLLISVPNGNWLVAEACSGIRYLIATVAISTIFCDLFLRSWSRRAIFVSVSILVAVGANGARAAGIIMLSYWTSNELATGVDHIIYGIVFFSFVTLATLGIGLKMREQELRPDSVLPAEPVYHRETLIPQGPIAAALILVVISVFKIAAISLDRPPASLHVALELTPLVRAPWAQVTDLRDQTPPRFVGTDRVWHQTYRNETDTVYLHIGYFNWERPGAEAVSSTHLLREDNAAIFELHPRYKVAIGGEAIAVNYLTFTLGSKGRALWYWYWVDGKFTGNPYLAKVLQLKAKLFGGQSAAAIITASLDYTGDPGPAERSLELFLSSFGPLIDVPAGASAE